MTIFAQESTHLFDIIFKARDNFGAVVLVIFKNKSTVGNVFEIRSTLALSLRRLLCSGLKKMILKTSSS